MTLPTRTRRFTCQKSERLAFAYAVTMKYNQVNYSWIVTLEQNCTNPFRGLKIGRRLFLRSHLPIVEKISYCIPHYIINSRTSVRGVVASYVMYAVVAKRNRKIMYTGWVCHEYSSFYATSERGGGVCSLSLMAVVV